MPASKPGARASERTARKKSAARRPRKPPALKEPEGGPVPTGRAKLPKAEGSRRRPGVRGPDAELTADDMRRKGSFLRRHFSTLRGPLVDAKGAPTPLARSAHAWGEAIPRTLAAAKRLAAKGLRLLARYKKAKTTKPP